MLVSVFNCIPLKFWDWSYSLWHPPFCVVWILSPGFTMLITLRTPWSASPSDSCGRRWSKPFAETKWELLLSCYCRQCWQWDMDSFTHGRKAKRNNGSRSFEFISWSFRSWDLQSRADVDTVVLVVLDFCSSHFKHKNWGGPLHHWSLRQILAIDVLQTPIFKIRKTLTLCYE